MSRLRTWLRRHYWFEVLFVLFIGFRLLAILLFRPGGFVADTSDYDFYRTWAQTIPMGYTTFANLWTAYPPLFPALMLPIAEWANQIAPWVEPRFFFHLLFGLELLLFEAGNLILIYRLAIKLAHDQPGAPAPTALDASPDAVPWPALLPPVLYALMFAPVYTLLGWFEAMPLFFLLLGLDLLLTSRRWGWIGSAIAAALGFLVKLTPILLVPVAVRWLGAKLSWTAARHAWFVRRSPGNLLKPALYVLIFGAVTILVGFPLARFNPQLALSTFRINSIRPPWQSVWALLEGYYGYGLVPVDMRNMVGYVSGGQWQSSLPWGLITLAFLAVYLWLYTRRYDWDRVRTPIAFTAVSVIWLLLYSKGWSPQFVVWIVAFLVLLTPTLHGVVIALALTLINFVESSVFLLMLPDEHWIMVGTVVVRTVLLVLLAAEWLGAVWPEVARGLRIQRLAARAIWIVLALALIGGFAGFPRAAQAYADRRLAEHPCRDAIALLEAEAGGPDRVIATAQMDLWQSLYPWLRAGYTLQVIDGYNPQDRPAAEVIGDKLANLAAQGEFWWIEQPASGASAPPASDSPLAWSAPFADFVRRPGIALLDAQRLGACQLARVAALPASIQATAQTDGGPILLRQTQIGPAVAGQPLHVVLYWQTDAPVRGSYTVFTQLFDPEGKMIAQQDNIPVRGLAPTNTWEPGAVIRDEYVLALPANAPAGAYTLLAGLYDAQGRRQLTLADGTAADHLTLPVTVH